MEKKTSQTYFCISWKVLEKNCFGCHQKIDFSNLVMRLSTIWSVVISTERVRVCCYSLWGFPRNDLKFHFLNRFGPCAAVATAEAAATEILILLNTSKNRELDLLILEKVCKWWIIRKEKHINDDFYDNLLIDDTQVWIEFLYTVKIA